MTTRGKPQAPRMPRRRRIRMTKEAFQLLVLQGYPIGKLFIPGDYYKALERQLEMSVALTAMASVEKIKRRNKIMESVEGLLFGQTVTEDLP